MCVCLLKMECRCLKQKSGGGVILKTECRYLKQKGVASGEGWRGYFEDGMQIPETKVLLGE